MAKLNVTLSSQGLDCRSKWVSFSCTGDFAPRAAAKTNFELAQLAFALGSEVRIQADDSRQHNNYCFASRIDVLR